MLVFALLVVSAAHAIRAATAVVKLVAGGPPAWSPVEAPVGEFAATHWCYGGGPQLSLWLNSWIALAILFLCDAFCWRR